MSFRETASLDVTEELVDFLRVSIGLQDRLKALVGGPPVPKSASANASEHSDYC